MANGDDAIRQELLAHGDDGKSPRHTLFYLYDGDIAGLEQAAQSNGFVTRRMTESHGLIIEKSLSVDGLGFAPVSAMIEQWAEEFGADYDGWECELVRP